MECLYEGVVALLDKNNDNGLMWILSFHTPWDNFLRKHCVVNI